MNDNNPILFITDVADSLPKLKGVVDKIVSDPVAFIFVFIFLIYLCVKFINNNKFIFNFVERKEEKTLEKIEKYLIDDFKIDDLCASVAIEQRNAIIFKNVTGIYVGKAFRGAIIELYNKMPYNVTWRMIRKSVSRFTLNDNNEIVIIKESRFDKVKFYYNYLMAFVLLITSVSILTSNIISSDLTFSDILNLIVIIITSIGGIIFLVSENLPYIFSRRIKMQLDKYNMNNQG